MEIATDFIFLGSKITADGDCRHEIERHLLLWRKTITNLDSILKSRNITLLTKIHLVKAMVFPSSHVWMWKLDHKESWTLKIWYFWTVVLETTLKSPLDCKEIKPVNLKGSYSFLGYEYSLEGLMLKLKLQYFGYLMWRIDSLGKILMLERLKAGGEGDNRGRDGWMASLTWWTWIWAGSRSWWQSGKPGMLPSMELQRVRHKWATELNKWEDI